MMSSPISPALNQSLAIDPAQVNQIYSNLSEADGLQQASEQFEAIFLQLVLKNMNSATAAISGDDGMFASREQRMYQDIYNAQISQSLAASGQIGLAEKMVAQIGGQLHSLENKFKEPEKTVAPTLEGNAFSQPLNASGINSGS
ncbi:rod-binding protein [Shewanella dokdonensis]|uniref:rod-binding protein n=1 Tax=Shewanella dokdonensis TaxID=712036 RepID=UPI00200CA78B|nr:rod-binding protein [Shewanella dokdonensis]MCL1073473.1 rod-binding protein [Shewanella dokdonensis]